MIHLYRLLTKLEGLGWAEEIDKMNNYNRVDFLDKLFIKEPESFSQGWIHVLALAHVS
jgi:hypothetical protein